MFGVKLTILGLLITIIYRFIVNALLKNESLSVISDIAIKNKYPKYVYVFVVLVVLEVIGVIYSVVWFLFLR